VCKKLHSSRWKGGSGEKWCNFMMVNQVETFLPSGSRSRKAPWNAKENDFHVQLKSHITIYKQSYFKEINKCIFPNYTNGLKIIKDVKNINFVEMKMNKIFFSIFHHKRLTFIYFQSIELPRSIQHKWLFFFWVSQFAFGKLIHHPIFQYFFWS